MRFWLIALIATASVLVNGQEEPIRLRFIDLQPNKERILTSPCFKRVEIGIALPDEFNRKIDNFTNRVKTSNSQKINPFLEWELDVEVEFKHIESGQKFRLDAFYYQDFQRDTFENTWHKLSTDERMRVRFCPGMTGKWEVAWFVTINGNTLASNYPQTLEVTKSNHPGFVKVHPNKRNFLLGDSIVYPVGVNFPSPLRNVSNYHTGNEKYPQGFLPNESSSVTKLSEWLSYHEDVAKYAERGGRFFRCLQSGWATLLEFEEKGNYYDRQVAAWEQDQLIQFCEEKGLLIHFNLLEQEPFMRYGNYDMFDWDFSHYRRDGSYDDQDKYPAYCYSDGKNKEPHEMFLNEEDLNYHEQRTRYYISRYGYSTSIYLMELLSEPWHLDQMAGQPELFFENNEHGKIVRKAVMNYQTRMAKFIKKNMNYSNVLVGIDVAYLHPTQIGVIDSSIFSPDIDVLSFNPYSPFPDKLLITPGENPFEVDADENSMYKNISWYQSLYARPVMMAEGGAGDGFDECCGFAQFGIDMATFGFTGLAGYYAWAGWNSGQDKLWTQVFTSLKWMNNAHTRGILSNGNGRWKLGRQAEKVRPQRDKKRLKELQYYVSENGTKAVGYVKNRTYNYHTQRTNQTCYDTIYMKNTPYLIAKDITWNKGKDLYVAGLQSKANYTVHWFSTETGLPVLSTSEKSKRGKLILKFPDLIVENEIKRPIVWFTITIDSAKK